MDFIACLISILIVITHIATSICVILVTTNHIQDSAISVFISIILFIIIVVYGFWTSNKFYTWFKNNLKN